MALRSLLALTSLASFGAALPSKHASRQSSAAAYITSSDGTYSLSGWSAPSQGSSNPPSGQATWNLYVSNTQKQTITGFGAALTDGSVTSINSLPSDQKQNLLNDLLDNAGFSLFRHTIGASDMSGNPAYTYDDSETADNGLENFGLGDRGTDMAQLIAELQQMNSDVMILGSPWSPPGWMKINGVIDGTTTNNNLHDEYLSGDTENFSQQWADYFVKYIQAYASNGAKVNAITPQNEPLNSNPSYPTMYMFSYEQADLINNALGPALANNNLGNVEIWGYDHNTDQPDFPTVVMQNAGNYVNTIAWHCYDLASWDVLSNFQSQFPGVSQYMTECWTPDPSNYQWGSANSPANWTVGPLMNWAKGVISWNLATESGGEPYLSSGGCQGACEGLVTISNGGYQFNQAYYVISQFSKFIPRGAIVLDGSASYTYSDGTGVDSVTTLNPDGTRTVVIVNKLSDEVYVEVGFTSTGETWNGEVPSESVVTWTLPPA